MTKSSAPAKAEPKVGEIAPLAPPSVSSMFEEVTLADIVVPKVYLMVELSDHVKKRMAEPGDLLLANGSTDASPIHLVGGDAGDEAVMYVLGRQKFAATTSGGTFEFQDARDPSDPESWEGWFFDVAIPEVEATIPARWRCWKTSGNITARAINTLLEKQFHAGNYDPLAIKVTTTTRRNRAGQEYWVATVSPAEPTDEALAIARELQATAAGLRQNRAVENDAPVVSEQPAFS